MIGGAFFLSFVLAALAGTGGRDQVLVARMREHFGPRKALTAIALACAVLTSAIAAWAGDRIGIALSDSSETMLVAFALVLAALELAWPRPMQAEREPTRSLGAVALILLARQLSDAPRLLVFALAAATGSAEMVAAGGALGTGAGLAIASNIDAPILSGRSVRTARRVLAAIGLAAGVVTALSARGLIG